MVFLINMFTFWVPPSKLIANIGTDQAVVFREVYCKLELIVVYMGAVQMLSGRCAT
jgi:hypothetical protein